MEIRCFQGFAQDRFGVLLSITSMPGCPETVVESEANETDAAPAPAPALARRMLAA